MFYMGLNFPIFSQDKKINIFRHIELQLQMIMGSTLGENAVATNFRVLSLRDVNMFSETSLIAASRGVWSTDHLPAAALLP